MTAESKTSERILESYTDESVYDNPTLIIDMKALEDEMMEKTEAEGFRNTDDSSFDATDRQRVNSVNGIYAPNPNRNSPLCLTPKLLSKQNCQGVLPPNWYRPRGSTPGSSTCSVSGDLAVLDKNQVIKKNMTCLYSFIYAVFVLSFGCVLFMYYKDKEKHVSEIFSCVIAGIGIIWLLFLHVDVHRYKLQIIKEIGPLEEICQENSDQISANTEFVFSFISTGSKPHSYRFLQGRHSGSFYLKCGMAAFCFGHMIHEGLQLGQQISHYNGSYFQRTNCVNPSGVALHITKMLYSFYQLFILFKYSNIVINRYKACARFALMHVIATCLCFWFSTIVEDTYEYYLTKQAFKSGEYFRLNKTIAEWIDQSVANMSSHQIHIGCSAVSILSDWAIQASPYLYPFSIEFNLLLAGVWIIMWQNIGKEHSQANPHPFRQKISTVDGMENVTYQSNLVISADCHASNKGLFAGLFILLLTIITAIVFFISVYSANHVQTAITINTAQETTLTGMGFLAVIVAYKQLSKLDINLHPITFLDDILLFLPLPFFFVHSILSFVAECSNSNYYRMFLHLLVMTQVIVQTPFIVDGLRKCSNSHSLRYKKPGREIITFLIILNLTMWIANTFEIRSVEQYYSQGRFFGEFSWLLIGHATLPLMLFYRFHSTVCLVDIWKSGYEKGE